MTPETAQQQDIEIVQDWEGPVYWAEQQEYFIDLDEAVTSIAYNLGYYDQTGIPEHVYCCNVQNLSVPTEAILKSLDEEYPTDEKELPTSGHVSQELRADLEELLRKWCEGIPLYTYTPNLNKAVRVRELIEEALDNSGST